MFYLGYPVVDGARLIFFEVPGPLRLYNFEFGAACLGEAVVRCEQYRAFVLCFVFVIFYLAVPIEFEGALLAHVEPVYFS